jgi:hypothetical protein
VSVTEIQYGDFVDTGAEYFVEEQPRVWGLAPYFAVGFVVGVLLPLVMRLTLG